MSPDDLIGTGEASAILGTTQRTAKRLAQRGLLPHAMKMPGDTGAYLFRRGAVEAFRAEREAAAAERAERIAAEA